MVSFINKYGQLNLPQPQLLTSRDTSNLPASSISLKTTHISTVIQSQIKKSNNFLQMIADMVFKKETEMIEDLMRPASILEGKNIIRSG